MDHASAECLHLLQRPRDVIDGEVRQRERVAGPAAPRMHTDRWNRRARLPAGSLLVGARFEFNTEQTAPETQRALGVVRWELDQCHRHLRAHDPLSAMSASTCSPCLSTNAGPIPLIVPRSPSVEGFSAAIASSVLLCATV